MKKLSLLLVLSSIAVAQINAMGSTEETDIVNASSLEKKSKAPEVPVILADQPTPSTTTEESLGVEAGAYGEMEIKESPELEQTLGTYGITEPESFEEEETTLEPTGAYGKNQPAEEFSEFEDFDIEEK